MATFPSQFRLEQRLKVKLGEAKNLLARSHGSIGQRDIYCVISLDKEEIFRSATVEKTLDPFFGEEFQFNIPREFRFLSFYLYDRDRPMKTDKIIGKVSVKKESLSSFHGKDQWFSITPVDADSEVQGKIHVEISVKLLQHMNDNFQQTIQVVIKECSDLSVVNGSCDPFAAVTMVYANHKEETKRTKSRKKTINPQFNEVFVFENLFLNCGQDKENVYSVEDAAGFLELRLAVWHELTTIFSSSFLGEVRIPISDLPTDGEINAWYFLQPREQASQRLSSKGELGTLRLNLHYTSDTVFMSHCYDSFRNLILQSCSQKYNSSMMTNSVAFLLGEVIPNKQEIAQPLTRILLQHGLIVPLLKDLSRLEISRTSDTNTLFRGNTLVSKCMDELMKLAGHHYLSEILKPILDNIFRERKPCEIDPARIPSTDNRETNMNNLIEYIRQLIEAISQSALNCPPVMCQIFSELRELANTYFPNKQEVRYSVISSFVFLRFFAPAILGPRLFDLTTEHIDAFTHRTLTLLSKAVQSIGNQVCFRNVQNSFKEYYMKEVFEHCMSADRSNKMVEGVRTYLEIISQIPNGNQKAYGLPVTLKEGVMVKRAQGRKKFGIKNFKTRFFRLTTREFSYYKKKGSRPLCTIPVDKILAVEKVEESSFKCKNMFQLVQGNRTLYMQAPNCVEEKEWIDLLTKVLQHNSHRLKQYHPGAYIHSHWLCCKATSESAPGCSAVSNYLDCNLKVQIDSDKEMERIYSLLSQNMEKLEELYNACESAVAMNPETRDLSVDGLIIDDPSTAIKSISSIFACMKELDQRHKIHQSTLVRTTRYGSKQAPIGDDNYLILASSAGLKNQQEVRTSTTTSLAKNASFRSSHKRC